MDINRKYYVVDRIEENIVVLEDYFENVVNVDILLFQDEITEGDVVYIDEAGKYFVDKEETLRRKNEIEDLIKDLWEN